MTDLSWLDPRVMSYADVAALVWVTVGVLAAVTARLLLRDLRSRWSQ